MSSILLKPITRVLLKFTAEYREETFFTWLPKVFHTTPPHPASNALNTLYALPLNIGRCIEQQNQFALASVTCCVLTEALWSEEKKLSGHRSQLSTLRYQESELSYQ